jgi:aminoglycoside phosphotransferase (APT) family kinase protein
VSDVAGIAVEPVTSWITERTALVAPLTFTKIEGGRSNLTFIVRDSAGQQVILRRPPEGEVLESAHDMGRENRLITALADTAVPVPRSVGYETDTSITGAPFYVMEFVDGVVLRTPQEVETHIPPARRPEMSQHLVDVLAQLHAVDVDAVGLGNLARREGYVERQLKRWSAQVAQASQRDMSLLLDLHDRLVATVPQPQTGARVVHGDYRLDNVIINPDTTAVAAVLDWEIATLGDPLADLAVLLVYWTQDGDQVFPLRNAPTLAPGFWTRDQVIARYQQQSGIDCSDIEFYLAFGYWKMACILEGVYTRFRSGMYDNADPDELSFFERIVPELAERSHDIAKASGR